MPSYKTIALLVGAAVLCGCATDAERLQRRKDKEAKLLEEANGLREAQKHREERSRYDAMISLNDKNARAHFRRGTTFMREAELTQDLKSYENRTSLYLEAIKSFNKAIELDESYESAYVCRAECHRSLFWLNHPDADRHRRRALADATKVANDNPRHPQANMLVGIYLQEMVLDKLAKKKAIHYFRMHLKAVEADPEIEARLFKLLQEFGDPDLEDAAAARERKPRPAPRGEGRRGEGRPGGRGEGRPGGGREWPGRDPGGRVPDEPKELPDPGDPGSLPKQAPPADPDDPTLPRE